VTEGVTSDSLADATVEVDGGTWSDTTDGDGFYALNDIDEGTYELT